MTDASDREVAYFRGREVRMCAAVIAAMVLAGSSQPRVNVGEVQVPEQIRTRMLTTLARVMRCETVEDTATISTCERLPGGAMRYTDRLKNDGSPIGELTIEPDFDGVQRDVKLPGGGWAREEHFTWGHPPEAVIFEDTQHTGHWDARTEGTLDGTRSMFHLLKYSLRRDGTWALVREWDARPHEVSDSALLFLASGDWERHLVTGTPREPPQVRRDPAAPVPERGLDLDNDGKPDIFPIAGETGKSGALRVRGIYGGDGLLRLTQGKPFEYEERAILFLRTQHILYRDTNHDGLFDEREVGTQWRWQSQPTVVEERDRLENGRWAP